MGGALDTAPLHEAAEGEIEKGLHACQIAVGFDGDVAWTQSFGAAKDATRFGVASATKPIVASAIWILIACAYWLWTSTK